jgi:hypothetical protein
MSKSDRIKSLEKLIARTGDEYLQGVMRSEIRTLRENLKSFAEERRVAADAALLKYDFAGMAVSEMSGWEYEQPGVEYTRTLFFVNPDEPEGDTLKGHFTVMFENHTSATVLDIFAMIDGTLIGNPTISGSCDGGRPR